MDKDNGTIHYNKPISFLDIIAKLGQLDVTIGRKEDRRRESAYEA